MSKWQRASAPPLALPAGARHTATGHMTLAQALPWHPRPASD
jgi:hypothetical protein